MFTVNVLRAECFAGGPSPAPTKMPAPPLVAAALAPGEAAAFGACLRGDAMRGLLVALAGFEFALRLEVERPPAEVALRGFEGGRREERPLGPLLCRDEASDKAARSDFCERRDRREDVATTSSPGTSSA